MSDEVAVKYNIGDVEIKLTPTIVQEYLLGSDTKITMPEFKMFTELCKVRKLNPFLKEAYIVKYSEKQAAQIVVGKDAILKRAVLNPQFNGREQGIIVLNESTGEITERKGTFRLPSEKLVGAWARIFRKDWDHPTFVSVSFDEVAQRKGDGQLNANWGSKGATMVEKVALVRALRETFVEDLGGLIDEDEAWTNTETTSRKSSSPVIIQDEPELQKSKVIDINEI